MPTPTYVAIAKTVLTGSQTTVVFSSIVSTYTDLVLVISARGSAAVNIADLAVKINALTANYTTTQLRGNSSTASSFRDTATSIFNLYSNISGGSTTSNTFGSVELYLPNYAGSTNKVMSSTGVAENNSSTAGQSAVNANASLLSNTAAITDITLSLSAGGDFVSGSRFDLYGIKNS